jgi:hypothetical protein
MSAIKITSDVEAGMNLQETFAEIVRPDVIVASVATYRDGKSPLGHDLGYKVAVQLIKKDDLSGAPRFDAIVRGTGDSIVDAIKDAQSRI